MQDSYKAPLAIAGRLMLAAIFLVSPLVNLIPRFGDVVASMRVAGVPAAPVALLLAIAMLLTGSLSLIAGYRARTGALLLVAFLVPATLFFHAPWRAADAAQASEQAIHFLKNIGLAGALLLIAAVGPGPGSVDIRRNRS
tara:strand:- start:218 stop:637 length:420 start_codon:yes stop_codon:yes gene_type:complete